MKKCKVMLGVSLLLMFMVIVVKPRAEATINTDVEKPLILIKGDQDVKLDYPGYRLISSNLNMDIVGEYTNLYQNKTTAEVVTKHIYVVEKNSVLNQTHCFESNTKICEEKRKVDLVINGIEKNSYYMICSQKAESNEPENVNLYLLYVLNGNIKYEKLIIENRQASIIDVKIDKEKIIIACNVVFKYSGLDLYIGTFDLDGNLLVPKFYSGMDYDAGEDIIVSNDAYYIVGSTRSVKGEIGGVRDGIDSFIMKLNKETLRIDDMYYYNLKGENICQAAIIIDEYIYMVEKYTENNLHKLRILKINLEGIVIDTVTFASGINVDTLQLYNWDGTIVVVTNETTIKSISSIYMIDSELNIHKIDEYSNNNMLVASTYLDNNELVALYHTIQNNKLSTFIRKIDLIYEEELIYALLEEDVSNYHVYDNVLYKLVNNAIYKPSFHYLRIDRFGSNVIFDDTTDINDYQILMDGQKIHLDVNKSNLEYDLNLFGYYNGIYYFSGKIFDLRYTQNLQVLSNPSIIPNENHDRNLVLTFNGAGILNGKPIESGYVIRDDGEYTLKLIGKDNVSVEYKFEVKLQSVHVADSKKTKDDRITKVETKIDTISPSNTIANIEYDSKNTSSKATNTIWWPLVIPVFLGSFSVVLIIKGGNGR